MVPVVAIPHIFIAPRSETVFEGPQTIAQFDLTGRHLVARAVAELAMMGNDGIGPLQSDRPGQQCTRGDDQTGTQSHAAAPLELQTHNCAVTITEIFPAVTGALY